MKKRFLFILMSMCTAIITFVSCNTDKEIGDGENQIKNEINLNNGACINESGNDFSIINLEDNKYENLDDKILIMNFNKSSGEYLYIRNNQYYIHYEELDILIEDKNVQAPLFSPNGEYLFYFVKDESLHPIVYDIKNSKRVELDIRSSISGTYASWFGNDKIAFYGVDTNSKTSGIFSYSIKNNLEKLEYQISGGYVSYIECLNSEIIFLVEKYSGEKILQSLDLDGNSTCISELVDEVYDIEKIDDDI